MNLLNLVLIVLLLAITPINSEEINLNEARDSYLDAYTESHGSSGNNLQQIQSDSREYTETYPHPASKPNFQYGSPVFGPSASLGPAKYGAPISGPANYGPPLSGPSAAGGPIKYGYTAPSAPATYPHHHHYPPPVSVYGPPSYHPPPYVEMPHGMLGILDKIKMKIDLFTIGKILLKLVIFKKIVSLIAILCLLLFIPSLKHKTAEIDNNNNNNNNNGDDYEDERGFSTKNSSGVDNTVTSFVIDAIENFAKNLTISDTEDKKCKEGAVCLKSKQKQEKTAKQQSTK